MQVEFERSDLKNTQHKREEEMAGKWILIALAAAASMVAMSEAATNHVVGGSSTGWTIPSGPSFYSQWASGQTFAVGDTLSFNFTTGIHNVIEVPKSSYDACSAKNQIGSPLTTGPATVTITSPGNHYYICGVTGHCSIGQKLAITVAPKGSSSSPAPAPAPKGSSSGPAPAPAPEAGSPAPSAAPSSASGSGMAHAPSSSGRAPAPAAGGPASSATPSGSTGDAGTSSGPSPSSPSDNQTPSVAAGPSGSGPSTSSASSSSLSSGYLTSFATAALLSATAAFFL